ncbi:Cyclin-F [Chionoecetes opilio]|uniref:Cyclin-F n=1 Tax=Chionoecetes opilio TaxID=41210 RepID=A0A8J4Y6G9_CHIOP|nr:Cyclin-F [Chionoecetes opilio]
MHQGELLFPLQELWPNEKTWRFFERAALCGNVEASIKLVVALLYNEGVLEMGMRGGLPLDKPAPNGELAFTLFEELESEGSVAPRSQLWLLYRPPWGVQPLCSKRSVFTRVAHVAQLKGRGGAAWAIRALSRICEVVPDGGRHSSLLLINWVKKALQSGDIHARLLQWRCRYEKRHRDGILDPGTELQAIRDIREMCLTGYYPATLSLSLFLATSRCPQIQGLPEIREFLQSSPPSRTRQALGYQQHVTAHMHHVLVDWLCEVANIRLHSSHVLHAAAQIVEAYLSMEQVTCNQLQLIGITAVLLATRFRPDECILTVTEACWVTDDTYCYSNVVRTIGNIMAALRGNVALPTILEYATVVLKCVKAPALIQEWSKYLCDLATTCAFPPKTTLAQVVDQSDCGASVGNTKITDLVFADDAVIFAESLEVLVMALEALHEEAKPLGLEVSWLKTKVQIAASCVMLGFILARLPWPNLVPTTGFTHTMLLHPLVIIYSKCFDMEDEDKTCQRRGIKDRYSTATFSPALVGKRPVPSVEEVLQVLSLATEDYVRIVEQLRIPDEGESASGGSKCSARTCPPQAPVRPILPHHLLHILPPRPPAEDDLKLDPDLPCGGARRKDSGMSGQWRGSEGSRNGHSSSMELSDSESGSASVSPVWENTHLRTSKSLSDESVPSSRHECVALDSCKAIDAVSQDQEGSMLPPAQHRHLEMPEQNVIPRDVELPELNVIPRDVGGENLGETTDSEENADLLPEACEGTGAKCARVNLKRKLENASESERSEKYLIRDVGKLQLG